jgi:hypothetical protein
MLRRAIDDPTTRARLSAVLSIFACVDIVLVWKSIEWFRTQHPGPVLEIRGGGGMAPGMEAPLWWNFLAFLMLATALILIRTRQEACAWRSMRCAVHANVLRSDHEPTKLHLHVLWLYGRLADRDRLRDLDRLREKKLRQELDRVKRMVEEGEGLIADPRYR